MNEKRHHRSLEKDGEVAVSSIVFVVTCGYTLTLASKQPVIKPFCYLSRASTVVHSNLVLVLRNWSV